MIFLTLNFLSAQQNYNRNINSIYTKALQFERKGNSQLAIFYYKQMLAQNGASHLKKEAKWRLAMIYKRQGELDQSFEYFKDVLTNKESAYRFKQALIEMLDILKIKGGLDSNIKYLDNLLKECPTKTTIIIIEKIKMYSYYNRNDFAYGVIKGILKNDPLRFPVSDDIFNIIDEAHKRVDFLALFDKLYQKRQIKLNVYTAGLDYFNEYEKMAAIYEARFKSESHNQFHLVKLVDIYVKSGKKKKAVQRMELLYRMSKDNGNYAKRLFKLYLISEQADKADSFIREFLNRPRQRSGRIQFYEELIQLYTTHGYLEKGLEFIKSIENNQRLKNKLYSQKAWILLKLGRREEAVNEYLRVRSLSPEKLAEYLYQMFLSESEIDKQVLSTLKKKIVIDSSLIIKYISIGMKYHKKCGRVLEGLVFFRKNSDEKIRNQDFLILTYIEPYLNDVRNSYSEKISVINYCTEMFKHLPTVVGYSCFSRFCLESERKLDFKAIKTFLKVIGLIEEKGLYILRDELRLQLFIKGAEFFFTRIKDLSSAEKYYKRALKERRCTSTNLSLIHCRLKEIDIINGKLNSENMTDEVNKIPLLYTKSDYLYGYTQFYDGKLKSASKSFFKMIKENLKDKVTNDALFKLYYIDKYMKGITGESLSNFLDGLREYNRGNFKNLFEKIQTGKITKPEIPLKFIKGTIDTFDKDRYESAVDTFKELVVNKVKSRFYSENSQLEVCRMGLSGKMDKNSMIIEFQTFLAFFEDSPYVDEIRNYLREYLKED